MAGLRIGSTGLALVIAGFAQFAQVRADRIILKGGTDIEGVVIPDPAKPDLVPVLMPSSTKLLMLPREKVERVERVPSALDDYVVKRKTVAQTAQAHYELGVWCEGQKLSGPAEMEFRAAVELDPHFGAAQQKLGKIFYQDRWLTQEEIRSIQGLVQYKGQWMTAQRKAELEAADIVQAGGASWTRRLTALRQKLLGNNEAARVEAEEALGRIKEQAAVKPLIRVFGNDPAEIRLLTAGVIGGIEGPDASKALIEMILTEPDREVRQRVMDILIRRKDGDLAPRFSAELKSKDPNRHGRAAWALAALNEQRAVPNLIPLLIHSQRKVVMIPQTGGNIGASFGGGIAPGGVMGGGGGGMFSGITGGWPVLTGPVVGPGVVAFGATSVPFVYDGVAMGGGGVAVPGAGGAGVASGPSNMPRYRLLYRNDPNVEVHDALVKLTGIDLGYDIAAWQKWLQTEFKPADRATKRVGAP
jgi:hypothetical protein